MATICQWNGAPSRHTWVALTIIVAFTGIRSSAQSVSTLLDEAKRLESAASECRRQVARGELDSCQVEVTFQNGRLVSPGQADALAAQLRRRAYEQQSRELGSESHLPPFVAQGQPVNARITNDVNNRSAYSYSNVIAQFEVAKNKRYLVSKEGATYCNIFVWDVTRAMNAEIPHYYIKDDQHGRSAVDPHGRFIVSKDRIVELQATPTIAWLNKYGKYHGWKRISIREAENFANSGHPVVAIWGNPNLKRSGHIAMVRPGSRNDERGAAEAQSGSLVKSATHLRDGFNDPELNKSILYWYHD